MNEYDANYWKCGMNITVGQFCDYVKEKSPSDAIFHVCGATQVYLDFSPEGNVFSVDHDSLSDLPEYEDCESGEFDTGEAA